MKSGLGFRFKIFSPPGCASVEAKSNLCKLLENVYIAISDKITSDEIFPMVMNKFSLLINGTFDTISSEWEYLIWIVF
jgi:hypothetical protein